MCLKHTNSKCGLNLMSWLQFPYCVTPVGQSCDINISIGSVNCFNRNISKFRIWYTLLTEYSLYGGTS